MMTRAGQVTFPCQGMTWHYARMQRSVFQAFDPLERLREAAEARAPAVPAGRACLRLTGRATLTENDFSLASRALAVVREHCHHCRNTPQAGRTTT